MTAALTGSVTEAAKKLSYGKSTVLYHIREVEKVCGVELFEREVRGFNLTRPGQAAYEISEKVLQIAAELKSLPTMDSPKGAMARLRGAHTGPLRSAGSAARKVRPGR
ncbi:LysR family transcriptional regulator [Streptomyces sp. NBC_00237]|uniref:LysR family transcriptional regulator n=1 Tax=Streptomyces sp. NBC_00237 TaxID=2975687 RepID=UPI0022598FB5|nr:LysR family transcriptional regulator [Streptomyces sp. NBC_00237]MCX5204522.1 LysR family transcriptional regulator [Streptomyces sp. NBC_00237]